MEQVRTEIVSAQDLICPGIPGTGHQGRFYADPACLTAYNKLVPERFHDLGSIGLYVELPFADE